MSNERAMNVRRSEREDQADVRDKHRAFVVLVLIVMSLIMAGMFAVLIARFNSLLRDNFNLGKRNHAAICQTYYREANGQPLAACDDVPVPKGIR